MKTFLVAAVILFCSTAFAIESIEFQIESGAVWQHRNDVRILPNSGTYLEFDKFNQGPFVHGRTEALLMFNQSHGIRMVLAPFQVTVTGRPGSNVVFNGVTYSGNQDLTVFYKFNSYRLGYVYKYTPRFHFGVTAKIRDAKIELLQGSLTRDYTNVGFVPLLYVAYETPISSKWHFVTNMDFAAAPQGRAIDFVAKVRRDISQRSKLGLGFRTLEGGADNDKVFTFSWFNYFVIDYHVAF